MNRNGQNIGAYTNIVKDSNYYFDMIINSVQNGEYTMFVEIEDNSGKKYCINLDFRNIQNKIINENGFEAYEAKFLADFLKATQSKNGKNVLVDTHRMAWRNYRR